MQWLYEDGATPFLRAAQSGDVELMKLLLAHGADPKIMTSHHVTALAVASGIGWVEGVTYEWSPEREPGSGEDVPGSGHRSQHARMRTDAPLCTARLTRAATRWSSCWWTTAPSSSLHDFGSRDTVNGDMKGQTWIPLHYAHGLVRVGVQSAIAHPETAAFIKKLMAEKGLEIPPDITSSICLTKGLKGCQ